MVSLSNSLKNLIRERLVAKLFDDHNDIIQELLNLEQVYFKTHDDIRHWLSKSIWANNVSVKKGQHLRLSAEGRHLFDLLVNKGSGNKTVHPFDKEFSNDHQLWLEMSRRCPVPWFVVPNVGINHRMIPSSTAQWARGHRKIEHRVEFFDYEGDNMYLTLLATLGDLKEWVKFLENQ